MAYAPRLKFLALLMSLLLSAVAWAQPLDVTISPAGKVGRVKQVVVRFSQPMVALGTDEEPIPPVALDPQAPGHWRWIDTHTLVFDPLERFKMASTFKVTVSPLATSLSGETLGRPEESRFYTGAPKLINPRFPHPGVKHGPKGPIELDFDQPVDPKEVLQLTRLSDGSRDYALQLVEPQLEVVYEGKYRVRVAPVEPLPLDTKFKVVLSPGLSSREGPLTSSQEQVTLFWTAAPLKFTRAEGDENRVYIYPNNNVELTDDHDLIQIDPHVPGFRAFQWGSRIALEGDFELGREYILTLHPGIQDIYGSTLSKPFSAKVKISEGREYKWVWTPDEGRKSCWIATPKDPRYPVYSENGDLMSVEFRKVSPSDWEAYEDFSLSRKDAVLPGVLLKQGDYELADGGITWIDLRPGLESETGHIILSLRSKQGDYVQSRHVWLQVTNLALTVWDDGKERRIRVNSLDGGHPVPLTEIKMPGRRPLCVTDAGGFATLPRDIRGAGSLIAQYGHDTAFLPRLPYEEPEPRFYAFDPQGVYRPGEMVTVQGYAPIGTTDIDYQLKARRDPTSNEESAYSTGTVPVSPSGGFMVSAKLPEDAYRGRTWFEFKGLGSHSFDVSHYRRGGWGRPGGAQRPRWYGYNSSTELEGISLEVPTEVKPGGRILAKIGSPFEHSYGLLSIDGKVVKSFDFGSPDYQTEIPVQEGQRPWVTATLELVGRAKNGETDRGVVEKRIAIKPAGQRLIVSLRPPTLPQPGEISEVEIQVEDSQGRPVEAEVTAMGTDDGLLRLTGHRFLDPVDQTTSTLGSSESNWDRVLTSRNVEGLYREYQEAMNSTLGVDASTSPTEGLRKDFRTVPLHSTVMTDQDGRARVPFSLPDTLTRYRLTAVAADSQGRMGLGEATMTVANLPISVEPLLPRYFRLGDQPLLPIRVHNNTRNEKQVQVSLQAQNLRFEQSSSEGTVTPGGFRDFLFPATVEGKDEIKLRAYVQSGEDGDAVERRVALRGSSVSRTLATYGEIPAGGSKTEALACPPGGAELQLTVAATPLFEAATELEEFARKHYAWRDALKVYGIIKALKLERELPTEPLERSIRQHLFASLDTAKTDYEVSSAHETYLVIFNSKPLTPKDLKEARTRLEALPPPPSHQQWRTVERLQFQRRIGEDVLEEAQALYELASSEPVQSLHDIIKILEDELQSPDPPEFRESAGYIDSKWLSHTSPLFKPGSELGHKLARTGKSHVEYLRALDLGKEVSFRASLAERTFMEQVLRLPDCASVTQSLDASDTLTLDNRGPGKLYYRIRSTGEWEGGGDRALWLGRSYQGLDDKDDVWRYPDGTWHVKEGARVSVELHYSGSFGGSRQIRDFLPAGLEAVSVGRADEILEDGVLLRYGFNYVARAYRPGTYVIPPAFLEGREKKEINGFSQPDRIIVHRKQ